MLRRREPSIATQFPTMLWARCPRPISWRRRLSLPLFVPLRTALQLTLHERAPPARRASSQILERRSLTTSLEILQKSRPAIPSVNMTASANQARQPRTPCAPSQPSNGQPAPTLCTPRPLKSSTNNTTASNRAVLDEQLFVFRGERSPNSC